MNWFGWTVLADLAQPDGSPCGHPHPAMVLRGPGADGKLWLLAISTKFETPLNKWWLECPWEKNGHPETGLWLPCVVKCDWYVQFDRNEILRQLGRIPMDLASRAADLAVEHFEWRQQQLLEQSRRKNRRTP
jgi:hypothetical protein